ncbi:ribosomal-processing cysteine protease Prp [Candidatus Phytoplasma melaleucae]|uniref:Ribosomal processing cysteine protease Prp n=1 Tax=Candidatus Phytoplasma melaleucae TaxID=2982630 RepID=A0ABT9DEQ1_9MOLU|nr:ribosomal-processing cysteine protease Prp ['Melaleuca sp.' phytoplasma]MDO8168142.1 ribosomal-processing cysteine protease Prp ['Melaleuca sp.' phytoplasma]MDV3205230.1 ribosomal-processing cysteine protease Prp [Weeping tea tree witches'-broom phytoplasma]
MIRYSFQQTNGTIKQVIIIGHASYSQKNNIVCSSVSTAIIVSLNAIEIFGLKNKVFFRLRKGYFKLDVLETDVIINNLLKNLQYTLKDLSKSFCLYLKEKDS